MTTPSVRRRDVALLAMSTTLIALIVLKRKTAAAAFALLKGKVLGRRLLETLASTRRGTGPSARCSRGAPDGGTDLGESCDRFAIVTPPKDTASAGTNGKCSPTENSDAHNIEGHGA
jgi:hypothetical protein